jgi:hypothetical protein
MIRRLLNLAGVIVLAPLIYAFTYEGIVFLASVFTFDATKWFLLGAALSLLGYVLLLNNHINFVEHLLHEMEHAALSFVFTFQFPRRMEIDPGEGSKTYVRDSGGCIMILAPYYFPLLTIPFLVLKALAALAFSLLKVPFPSLLAAILNLLIGATLMFHYVCTLKEFGLFQTDIRGSGLIPSLVAVFFLNFVFLILSVTVVTDGYTQFLDYAKIALAATADAYSVALTFLTTRLVPALGALIERVKVQFCPGCTPTPAP